LRSRDTQTPYLKKTLGRWSGKLLKNRQQLHTQSGWGKSGIRKLERWLLRSREEGGAEGRREPRMRGGGVSRTVFQAGNQNHFFLGGGGLGLLFINPQKEIGVWGLFLS
jgi:hypothetical protein